MNNKETKEHILKWCEKKHGQFSWPTDGCGYDQHIKFVKYRNKNYKCGMNFTNFVINYANTQLQDVVKGVE